MTLKHCTIPLYLPAWNSPRWPPILQEDFHWWLKQFVFNAKSSWIDLNLSWKFNKKIQDLKATKESSLFLILFCGDFVSRLKARKDSGVINNRSNQPVLVDANPQENQSASDRGVTLYWSHVMLMGLFFGLQSCYFICKSFKIQGTIWHKVVTIAETFQVLRSLWI